MIVRRLGPDEVDVVRAVRLAALGDSPGAFGSTVAREAAFTDDDWRGRLRPTWNATFVAEVEGAVVGMVAAVRDDEAAPVLQLVGMWVAPHARGGATASCAPAR